MGWESEEELCETSVLYITLCPDATLPWLCPGRLHLLVVWFSIHVHSISRS